MCSREGCFAREEVPPNAQVIAWMAHGAGYMPVKTAKKAVYTSCVQVKARISLLYMQKMPILSTSKTCTAELGKYEQTRVQHDAFDIPDPIDLQ